MLSADICGIKDAYALAGENLTAAYADIVLGTIFDPYLVDGAFDPEAVRIETETQARRLEAEFNSKRLYCVRQARRKFYGDTPAGIELGGYPGELVNVTPQSLKAEYDRILSTAYIDVMVQGVDEARVADMLLKKLDGIDAMQWHNWIDHPEEYGLRIGLRKFPNDPDDPMGRKLVWYAYQAAGTSTEDAVFEPYKAVIGIDNWNIIQEVQ